MQDTTIHENEIVSSVQVTDLEGVAVDLMEKYKGQNLLFIIYNNDCLGCTGRAIPLAYAFQQQFDSIQAIGIHSNFGKRTITKAEIESIFTTKEVPFPIYIDPNHRVYDQFDSEGTPQWLLIKSNGILFKSIFGSQEGAQMRLTYALEELLAEKE